MNKILVVSHDAGGAEVISAWVKQHPEFEYSYLLAGPAIKIFQRKLSDLSLCAHDQIDQLISHHDTLLLGTSWVSDLEKRVLTKGLEQRKLTITFLDHWCDYSERFLIKDKTVLPGEIWVGDNYAFKIAKNVFPQTKITLIENYYFNEIKSEFQHNTVSTHSGVRVLYICEPITAYAEKQFGSVNYYNYTEMDALDYFFSKLKKANYVHLIDSIILRPHPAEPPNKYDDIVHNEKTLRLSISNQTLVEDIQGADWVVGCSSMVLVLSLLAEKKVFTCIPPNANVFKLPHQEIELLPDNMPHGRG